MVTIKSNFMNKAFTKSLPLLLLVVLSFSCQKNLKEDAANSRPGLVSDFTPKELKNFVQINLVGDKNIYTPQNIDAGLVNAWDITFAPTGPAWVSSEGKGTSPIYNFDGVPVANAVRIPDGDVGSGDQGHPTGHLFNPTSDFKLPNGSPAQFIFASADGTISGWNSGITAIKKIDNSASAS